MTTFEFSLKFSVPEDGVDTHVERLGEAGCDDALIGVGRPGRIALDFDRAADSAFAAVAGAVSEVRAAYPRGPADRGGARSGGSERSGCVMRIVLSAKHTNHPIERVLPTLADNRCGLTRHEFFLALACNCVRR